MSPCAGQRSARGIYVVLGPRALASFAAFGQKELLLLHCQSTRTACPFLIAPFLLENAVSHRDKTEP